MRNCEDTSCMMQSPNHQPGHKATLLGGCPFDLMDNRAGADACRHASLPAENTTTGMRYVA